MEAQQQEQNLPERIRNIQQRIKQLDTYSKVSLALPLFTARFGLWSIDSTIKASSSGASSDYIAVGGSSLLAVITGFIWAALPTKQWNDELGILMTELDLLQAQQQQVEGQGEIKRVDNKEGEEGVGSAPSSPSPTPSASPRSSSHFSFTQQPSIDSKSAFRPEIEVPLLKEENQDQDPEEAQEEPARPRGLSS